MIDEKSLVFLITALVAVSARGLNKLLSVLGNPFSISLLLTLYGMWVLTPN